jgi:hypothetical protein
MKTESKKADKEKTAKKAGTEVTFQFDKETPGAVRFKELDDKGEVIESADDGAIGSLYVRKAFLKRSGIKNVPDGCTITITFA